MTDEEMMNADLEAAYLDVQALKMSVANHQANAAAWKKEARNANAVIAKAIAYLGKTTGTISHHELIAILTGVSNV